MYAYASAPVPVSRPARWALAEQSIAQLGSCDKAIIMVVEAAIAVSPVDFCVHEGHRTQARQQQLYREGASKCDGVSRLSKHQGFPSRAVDLLPYPVDWKDRERFALMAGAVLAIGAELGVRLRWGADWDSDGNLKEHKFRDYPHFELF